MVVPGPRPLLATLVHVRWRRRAGHRRHLGSIRCRLFGALHRVLDIGGAAISRCRIRTTSQRRVGPRIVAAPPASRFGGRPWLASRHGSECRCRREATLGAGHLSSGAGRAESVGAEPLPSSPLLAETKRYAAFGRRSRPQTRHSGCGQRSTKVSVNPASLRSASMSVSMNLVVSFIILST